MGAFYRECVGRVEFAMENFMKSKEIVINNIIMLAYTFAQQLSAVRLISSQ